MFLPWASSARALCNTSKADSIPIRVIRSAKFICCHHQRGDSTSPLITVKFAGSIRMSVVSAQSIAGCILSH